MRDLRIEPLVPEDLPQQPVLLHSPDRLVKTHREPLGDPEGLFHLLWHRIRPVGPRTLLHLESGLLANAIEACPDDGRQLEGRVAETIGDSDPEA